MTFISYILSFMKEASLFVLSFIFSISSFRNFHAVLDILQILSFGECCLYESV